MGRLGTVTATIKLATDAFSKSRQIIQSESQMVAKSVEGIGDKVKASEKLQTGALVNIANGFDVAKKSAEKFNATPLGKVAEGLKQVQGQVLAVTAVFGGIAAAGLNAARNTLANEKAIRGLTGSADAANKVLAKTQALSDEFGVPYQELAAGARAFLPLAKTTGIAVEDLLKTATRFQAYNPAKNFDEIKFSLNEALTGDFVSIKDSLDLSRKQRDELKQIFDEQGATGVQFYIDNLLQQRGITDEFVKGNIDQFKVLGSEVSQAMSDAFMPVLEDVVLPLVKQIAGFFKDLRENNPELLKAMGIFAIGVAGVGALITALGALISAYKTLQTISDVTGGNLAGNLGKVAKVAATTALALEAGNRIGLGAVSLAANAGVGDKNSDFQRLRNGEDAGAVVGERAKQAIVIILKLITDGLIGVIRVIVDAFSNLGKAITFVIDVFKFFGTFLTEFVGNLQTFIGNLLLELGNRLSGLFDTTDLTNAGVSQLASGDLNVRTAQKDRQALGDRITKGIQFDGNAGNAFADSANQAQNDFLEGLTNLLFPLEKGTEAVNDLGDKVETVAKKIGDSEEYLAQQAEDIANSTKQFNDDVKKIEDDYNQSRLNEIDNYNKNIVKIAQDAADDSAKALKNMIDARDKLRLSSQRDEEKEGRKFNYDQLDNQIKAQRDEVKATQDHADRLVKIRQDAQRKEQGLLLNLDFAGLFELRSQTKDSLDSASEDFNKQREERNLALSYELQDMQTAFGRERQERQIKFEQDLADESTKYQAELAQGEANKIAKLAQAQTEHQQTLQQLATKHANELALRQQAYRDELTLLMQTEAQRKQIMMQTQQELINQAYAFLRRTPPQANTPTRQPVSTANRPVSNSSGGGGNLRRTTRAFANGGVPPVGQFSMVNEGFAGQMERFTTGSNSYALPGGAGLFMPFQNGRIEPNSSKGSPNVTININGAQDPSRIKSAVLDALREVMR